MYEAVNDRVIVRLDKMPASSTVIGLYEPPRTTGTVVSTGSKVRTVSNGEHVMFHIYDEIALPAEDLVVVREKSILAKLI